MGPGCSSHRLSVTAAVEAHKIQEEHRVLACQHMADKGTVASHAEPGVDTVAAGLVDRSLAVAGLCRSFQHRQSCLEHEKVLKGKVQRIDEGAVSYIHRDSVGYRLLITGLPTSGHNI